MDPGYRRARRGKRDSNQRRCDMRHELPTQHGLFIGVNAKKAR